MTSSSQTRQSIKSKALLFCHLVDDDDSGVYFLIILFFKEQSARAGAVSAVAAKQKRKENQIQKLKRCEKNKIESKTGIHDTSLARVVSGYGVAATAVDFCHSQSEALI